MKLGTMGWQHAQSSGQLAHRALLVRLLRRRSHRIACRRAAEERVDTLLVGERRQSRRIPDAIRSERQRAIKQRKDASAPSSSAPRVRDHRRLQARLQEHVDGL